MPSPEEAERMRKFMEEKGLLPKLPDRSKLVSERFKELEELQKKIKGDK